MGIYKGGSNKMGLKKQGEKTEFTHFPIELILEALGKVTSYGAKKYSPDNYKNEEIDSYVNSFFRHFIAWRRGEKLDESGFPHIYHMLTNIAFILCIEENKSNTIQDCFEKLSNFPLKMDSNSSIEEHRLSKTMIEDMIENGL